MIYGNIKNVTIDNFDFFGKAGGRKLMEIRLNMSRQSWIWDQYLPENMKWNLFNMGQETKKPRNFETKTPRRQETKKPWNHEAKKLRNQEAKKPTNRETKKLVPLSLNIQAGTCSHPCTQRGGCRLQVAGVGVGMLSGAGNSLTYLKVKTSWFLGFLVFGFLVSWFQGFLLSWCLGFSVSKFLGFLTSQIRKSIRIFERY